ncbi:MAG: deaminated glutathione amidase [Solirubrobacterales bacterium]|jgi:predicted amidohydrolase|nr:deaminated glutathione amidase [Solirubrobacterales bacterium]
MRAAVIQINSDSDVASNLERAEKLVRAAASDGAELVCLPEKWALLGPGEVIASEAEPLDGPIVSAAAAWALELGIHLCAGSVPEDPGDGGKPYNTSVLIDSDGEITATYRKLHMFDVEVDGTEYRESEHERAGEQLATATAGELELGLTVCYDLRFPELFRILALRGATAFTVPAAFTAVTGRAHWEILLRARAVENSAFVIAAGQVGKAEPHYESWGHSMLVDPWGRVLAAVEDGEGQACADLDLAELRRVRESLPSLANRRADAYEWPVEAPV